MNENGLTHFDSEGKAIMVDVSEKKVTERSCCAVGSITLNEEAFRAVIQGTAKKGDVLGTARIAGIMAVKKTAELIPLCHVLPLDSAKVDFELHENERKIDAFCTVRNEGKTGVEMEALTGVSVALLTIYDMLKAVDRRMVMGDIHLVRKTGGRSGDFRF